MSKAEVTTKWNCLSISTQIGVVEHVEHFGEDGQLVLFVEGELLGQPNVLRVIVAAKAVVAGRCERWDRRTAGVLLAGQAGVPVVDSLRDVLSGTAPIDAVGAQAGK